MARVVILLAILVGLLLFLRWFVRTPPKRVIALIKRVGLWTVIGVLTLLAATGRLNWVFAAAAAAVPLAQRLLVLLQLAPHFQRLMRLLRGGPAPGGAGPQSSTVTTRYLRMQLDHASGVLSGVVLEGAYRGRSLESLKLEELLDLLAACRVEDAQSAAVLEAYLDRVHGGEWRSQTGDRQGASGPPTVPVGAMTREQAREVLGLTADASDDEIRTAHRRLMQKLHPDRGGSDYLAALLNRAKDVLLKR